ncbi:hypothetical protein, partial [Pseudomonas aeruginosa]|uniref:hypothetical protein n=1 Tax=Pseudomonas aeruginosa TaxID=287 RepID=UPI001BD45139
SGTFVRACINYEYEKLLEKALVFNGKSHTPAFDFIDRKYQSDGEDIRFIVKEELNAFGTRAAGKLARQKIENLMDNSTTAIEFD